MSSDPSLGEFLREVQDSRDRADKVALEPLYLPLLAHFGARTAALQPVSSAVPSTAAAVAENVVVTATPPSRVRRYGPNVQFELHVDELNGTIRIVRLRTVAETVEDPSYQVSLEEARAAA